MDWERLEGTATLTHDFPDAPIVAFPAGPAEEPRTEIDAVGMGGINVAWNPVANTDLDSCELIVTNQENQDFACDICVPNTKTSMSVPGGFFTADANCEVEVLARAAQELGGNQVVSIECFKTPPWQQRGKRIATSWQREFSFSAAFFISHALSSRHC
jgi:hypothetical protein